MEIFNLDGIIITASSQLRQINYKDPKRGVSTRLEREVNVTVSFWRFTLNNSDLLELAYVKSSLQYFLNCYWKRSSKEGSKIVFEKMLHHEDLLYGLLDLCFTARQKNKQHYLHVCVKKGDREINTVYLDGHEVMLLDIAIGKAISWLSPVKVD